MKTFWWIFVLCLSDFWLTPAGLGDQVIMRNGDIYNGRVLSVTTNALLLKSEILGGVTLPRSKIATIHLGAAIPSNSPSATAQVQLVRPVTPTNAAMDLATSVRGIETDTNLVQQVQAQILGSSSPEARAKFNQMLDDLSSGKMDMNGLRAEAQSAADQLRAFNKEMGPNSAGETDDYLKILDQFLKETEPQKADTATPANQPGQKTPQPDEKPQPQAGDSP